MEKIHVGKIVNAVALKGEVKVYTYSNPERYEEIKEIYVENKPHKIEKVRFQGNTVILKLSGIDDRNAAEACKGKEIYIAESELPALPEDTYYIRDLIGMDVVTEDGEKMCIRDRYICVIGEREAEAKTLTVRSIKSGELGEMSVDDFTAKLVEEIRTKAM